jgi:hypothetical protein
VFQIFFKKLRATPILTVEIALFSVLFLLCAVRTRNRAYALATNTLNLNFFSLYENVLDSLTLAGFAGHHTASLAGLANSARRKAQKIQSHYGNENHRY